MAEELLKLADIERVRSHRGRQPSLDPGLGLIYPN